MYLRDESFDSFIMSIKLSESGVEIYFTKKELRQSSKFIEGIDMLSIGGLG